MIVMKKAMEKKALMMNEMMKKAMRNSNSVYSTV
jgi:hypothetical protein